MTQLEVWTLGIRLAWVDMFAMAGETKLEHDWLTEVDWQMIHFLWLTSIVSPILSCSFTIMAHLDLPAYFALGLELSWIPRQFR